MAEISKRELAFLERLIQRAMNRGDPEAAALLEEQPAVAMHDLGLLRDELERIMTAAERAARNPYRMPGLPG
jgi:hypothetical protein